MRIANWYRLHKDGEFYFLYRDRFSFMPNDHATKLNSALRKLSKSSLQRSANVKTELTDEKVCVQSLSKSEEAVEKMVREEENLVLTNGITAQHEDKMVPVAVSATPETAVSLPNDIQIHVQRPSPIREVPGNHQKMFSVGTAVDSKDGEQEVALDSVPLRNAAEVNTEVFGKEPAYTKESSTDKDEVASCALENMSSNIVTKVRPISGPATITCTERPEFDFVRKSRSVTNSLDEDGEQAGFAIRSRRSVGAISSMTQDTSEHPAKDSIRRIYSTVSFDRQSLKSPGLGFEIDEAVDLSARGISVQTAMQKANFYGLRSRHTSGLETPMSALDTSSVTSTTEAGILLLQ